MTPVAFSFHLSGKWEFAWKQDTNAVREGQTNRKWEHGKKWVNLVPWRQGVHLVRGWKIDLSGATDVTQRLFFKKNQPVEFIIGSFSFWAISLVKVAYSWFGGENRVCFGKAASHFWPFSPHLLILSLVLMQWNYEFVAGGASWYIISSFLFKWQHL